MSSRALIATIVLLLTACDGGPASTTSFYAEGEVLYSQDCSECHGPGGVGTDSAPAMLDPKMIALDDAAFVSAVAEGVEPGKWPGYSGMDPMPFLSHSDIADVINYVRHLQGVVITRP